MNRHRIASVLLVAGAIIATGVMSASAQQDARGQNLSVAVVHLEQLLGNLRAINTLRAEINQGRERLQAMIERRQNELRAMENQLNLLTPGTQEWSEKAIELEEQSMRLQTEQSYEQVQLARHELRTMERIYRQVLSNVRAVADERNIDLVLMREGDFRLPTAPPGAEQQLAQQLQQQIAMRKVLFASDRLDITNAVKDQMER